MQQGRMKEATKHFREAVKSNPQNIMAYHFLGYSLVVHERDLVAARKLLQELDSLHPQQAKELAHLISLND
jgi:Flp pilus assembly protein TadD